MLPSAGTEVEVKRSTHRSAQGATIPPVTVCHFHLMQVLSNRESIIDVVGKIFLCYRSFIASPGAKDDQSGWNTATKICLCPYT